jgi:hypothetical protein
MLLDVATRNLRTSSVAFVNWTTGDKLFFTRQNGIILLCTLDIRLTPLVWTCLVLFSDSIPCWVMDVLLQIPLVAYLQMSSNCRDIRTLACINAPLEPDCSSCPAECRSIKPGSTSDTSEASTSSSGTFFYNTTSTSPVQDEEGRTHWKRNIPGIVLVVLALGVVGAMMMHNAECCFRSSTTCSPDANTRGEGGESSSSRRGLASAPQVAWLEASNISCTMLLIKNGSHSVSTEENAFAAVPIRFSLLLLLIMLLPVNWIVLRKRPTGTP